MTNWRELSNELHKAIQAVGKSVITVQAEGNRTVSGIVLDERTIVTTASVIGDGEKIRSWISPDQQIDASGRRGPGIRGRGKCAVCQQDFHLSGCEMRYSSCVRLDSVVSKKCL